MIFIRFLDLLILFGLTVAIPRKRNAHRTRVDGRGQTSGKTGSKLTPANTECSGDTRNRRVWPTIERIRRNETCNRERDGGGGLVGNGCDGNVL